MSKIESQSPCLTQIIKSAIQDNSGWISFADFMQKALYEPELGYYMNSLPKFGKTGDFITAPEVSPLFSECLARYCAPLLAAQSSILEFGAGRGVMASDILLSLEKQHSLPKHYFILEISPFLRQQQKEMLKAQCPHLFSRVKWLENLPEEFEGIVLANEVLDAFPVHIFEMQKNKMLEKGVGLEEGKFVWRLNPLCIFPESLPEELVLEEGAVFEHCFVLASWLKELYRTIKQGRVLFIDYGFLDHEYYHPERHEGTLMCHYRHQAHADPFLHVGEQDITAHVNFSHVARVAEAAGFLVENYATQAEFLMSLGILDQKDLPVKEHYTRAQALKKLLLPSEMGELFKVMVLHKELE